MNPLISEPGSTTHRRIDLGFLHQVFRRGLRPRAGHVRLRCRGCVRGGGRWLWLRLWERWLRERWLFQASWPSGSAEPQGRGRLPFAHFFYYLEITWHIRHIGIIGHLYNVHTTHTSHIYPKFTSPPRDFLITCFPYYRCTLVNSLRPESDV